jgi:hypothetical protein
VQKSALLNWYCAEVFERNRACLLQSLLGTCERSCVFGAGDGEDKRMQVFSGNFTTLRFAVGDPAIHKVVKSNSKIGSPAKTWEQNM